MRFSLVRCLGICCALLVVLVSEGAAASVVMNTTRVIYAGDGDGESLQFSNDSGQPSIVQVWLDSGDPASTPATADAPFIAIPQIFRVEPDAGQTVRLNFTGNPPASDRESLYYLNFSQLPAMKDGEQGRSRLVMMFNSRMKVFYRPKGLMPPPTDPAAGLRFQRNGTRVNVQNPTAYHVVVRRAALLGRGGEYELTEPTVIVPFSTCTWDLPVVGPALRLELVNDYGADIASIVELP